MQSHNDNIARCSCAGTTLSVPQVQQYEASIEGSRRRRFAMCGALACRGLEPLSIFCLIIDVLRFYVFVTCTAVARSFGHDFDPVLHYVSSLFMSFFICVFSFIYYFSVKL